MSAFIETAVALRWIIGAGCLLVAAVVWFVATSERRIADAYHQAGVVHGSDLRRIDKDVERALREGER